MGFISMMEFSYTLNNIFEILKKNGLNARLRSEHKADWNVVWQRLPMQPTSISESMIDYQHAYLRSTGSSVLDLSMVIFNDGKPCAIWPLTLSLSVDKEVQLSSIGEDIKCPYFIFNLSLNTQKKNYSTCCRFSGVFERLSRQ